MVRKKVTPRRDAGRARGEAVARAVFAATLEELGSSGVEGLSIERVAERAEVNKTSIYRRWPTREELIVATLEDATADVVSMADTGSLRGDLLALLKRVNELLTHPTGRAILRASASVSADSRIKLLAQERLMAQAMLPVQSLVERARARGEWRDEVKGEVVIFALVGAVMHRVTMEPGKVSSAWLNALVDVMLLGVLPR
jgi:AcrR family transcriptional regulator